ncbi:MAG: hypothetical protein KDK53_01940 [Maritimibacter sp.]|nr:hypothetical protein [Maritimibacter sp.]
MDFKGTCRRAGMIPALRPNLMVGDMRDTGLPTRIARFLLKRFVHRTDMRILASRSLNDVDERQFRWLGDETKQFLSDVETDVAARRPAAKLGDLPSFGNRPMVDLAINTVSADRVLRRLGAEPSLSADIVADIGWETYRGLLSFHSAPIRLITRYPGRRPRWTNRLLLVFPFNPSGAPGYRVQVSREGPDILTRFINCPPLSFARRLGEATGDLQVLEAFKRSSCSYDWPSADWIARDGCQGHYRRTRSPSQGDPECGMCWRAGACLGV